MAKILVLNGPNLNLLGMREPEIYGTLTLADVNERLRRRAESAGLDIEFLQSNHEGVLVDAIQAARGNVSYIILNAAAFTHYSIAIRDAITAAEVPVIEVQSSAGQGMRDEHDRSYRPPAGAPFTEDCGCRSYHKGGEPPLFQRISW